MPCFAALILAAASSPPHDAQGEDPPLPRVLLIGDSISSGYHKFVKRGLEGRVEVRRIPGNGRHTGVGLELLDTWLGEEPWDLVHFNWGLHDLCYRRPDGSGRDKANGEVENPLPVYEANLDALARRLKKTGARLVFATTTPSPPGEDGRFAGDSRRYNAAARRVMQRHGIPIDDLYAVVASRMAELARQPGDVHFGAEGSQLLGRQVVSSVEQALGMDPLVTGERPDVVVVVTDDLGWSDLACTGSPSHLTPHLDRLAANGVRFTQAYASCAVCSPTRAALMTGRDPARVGVTDWIHHVGPEADEARAAGRSLGGFDQPRGRRMLTPRNHVWLADEEVTIAELLSEQGYRCGYVGKWHLGGAGHLPTDQGFHVNKGGCAFGQPPSFFDPYSNRNWDGIPDLAPREEGEYLTDREADECVSFLQAHRDEPFLLYYAPYAVHAPIQAPADEVEAARGRMHGHHDNPTYAAMVEAVDRAVGRIVAELESQEKLDSTLIVFTSDNGGAVHFDATDNRPLRKGKGFAYEGGLRVPLLVHWPDAVEGGRLSEVPVCSVDLFPTIAQAAGVALPAGREIDGLGLLAHLRDGAGVAERPLLWHFPHYWWGTRITPYGVLREGPWKLIERYEDGARELFRLDRDPGEANDLAAEEHLRVARMGARLHELLDDRGARRPVPNPDFEGGRPR